jgi:hypothetical protein
MMQHENRPTTVDEETVKVLLEKSAGMTPDELEDSSDHPETPFWVDSGFEYEGEPVYVPASLSRIFHSISYAQSQEIDVATLNVGPKEYGGTLIITLGGARALAECELFKGGIMFHGALEGLSRDVASELAKIRGKVLFIPNEELESSLLESLCEFKGELQLGCRTLPADRAEKMAGFRGLSLKLCKVENISDEGSEFLSRVESNLNLSGLTELSDKAAEYLSHVAGNLNLESLNQASDRVIQSLSSHKGDLVLNGLTDLSANGAEWLSKHRGSVSLINLGKLTDAMAESFACHREGTLNFSRVRKISDKGIKALAKRTTDTPHDVVLRDNLMVKLLSFREGLEDGAGKH